MKWFEGSINDAVVTSKSRKAIFVVFVEGKDETSMQVAQAINATEVSTRLEQQNFVSIRLESGSEAYRFFAQIYQLVPVPSLFFIGTNGTPLEIVAGAMTAPELVDKIDMVLTKAGKSNVNSSLSLIDAEKNAVDNTIDKPGASVTTGNTNINISKAETEVQLTNIAKENVPIDSDAEPSTSLKTTEKSSPHNETKTETGAKELTAEEKLERARQLIELQKKQRIEEEERKEKEREMERRKMGREVQKMRQKQQDLEVKQAYDETVKERAAEAAAREKVRQQIAQDKLERKQKELDFQQQMQRQQTTQEQAKAHTAMASDATITRIQFRLPSGSAHMGQFEPTSTLRTLRTYVVQNIDLPFRHFAMSTSFPRRDLVPEDDNKTLLELELVPTAVILILPLKNVIESNATTAVTSTQDVGLISRFVWSFFAPILGVYNYLIGYFSSGTNTNTERQRSDPPSNGDGTVIPNVQNIPNTSGLFRRYLNSQRETTVRAEGNVHRLHSGGDDNDENNTWNGNSTQQM